jgi:hypothetical protein
MRHIQQIVPVQGVKVFPLKMIRPARSRALPCGPSITRDRMFTNQLVGPVSPRAVSHRLSMRR